MDQNAPNLKEPELERKMPRREKDSSESWKAGNTTNNGKEDEEDGDYLPTRPSNPGNDTRNDTQKTQGGEKAKQNPTTRQNSQDLHQEQKI